MEAMRCLRRHLARHYHRPLLRPVSTSGCTKAGSEQSDSQDAASLQLHRSPQLGGVVSISSSTVSQPWEYAIVELRRDKITFVITGHVGRPETPTTWEDLGEVSSGLAVLNEFGADGWEVVGSPTVERAVTASPGRGGPVDHSWWITTTYLLKRPAR
jgi:hypothetical protein